MTDPATLIRLRLGNGPASRAEFVTGLMNDDPARYLHAKDGNEAAHRVVAETVAALLQTGAIEHDPDLGCYVLPASVPFEKKDEPEAKPVRQGQVVNRGGKWVVT